MFGLSKERPILDHHAKAHILDFIKNPADFTPEIRRISKDQLPGMVSPMFPSFFLAYLFSNKNTTVLKINLISSKLPIFTQMACIFTQLEHSNLLRHHIFSSEKLTLKSNAFSMLLPRQFVLVFGLCMMEVSEINSVFHED